jgi:oligoendopeptidase F
LDNRYVWATEDIFTSKEEWNKTFSQIEKKLDFSKYKGKLGEKAQFLSMQKQLEQISMVIEKLAVYAMMKHDENTKDSVADAMNSKINSLCAKFSASVSFINPELTALDEEILKSYIQDADLKDYDYYLKGVLKSKAHVLSDNEEKLLAKSAEVFGSFKDIFSKIDDADLPLGKIKTQDGVIPLTHGTYSVLLQNPDQQVRKTAFKKYYKAYVSLINTISATYYGNVKKGVFVANARKYDSVLQMALSNEDVSERVYENLLETVNGALPTLHRYMQEKKNALGVDKMHMYDIYVPTVPNADLKLDYDKAYDLVIEGLAPLGKDYQTLLAKAREQRWIDVYEKDGKRSGAYSCGVYTTHPFVLLNYQKTTHDVFTIAHEMGHSLHSYFSNKTQPYSKADYTIFVAEVASTVNEVLLCKHLLSTATDKKLKKYLLSYLLEMIRTTLFRQTQFAEFEHSRKPFEKYWRRLGFVSHRLYVWNDKLYG